MAAADAKAKRREERIKLFATALSNVGVAAIIAGFISPLFGGRFHPASAAGALLLGLGIHFVAQTVLHYVVGPHLADDAEDPGDVESET